jgi:acyl-coenzyme A synthetase/AMP-(fatty) acid ligase
MLNDCWPNRDRPPRRRSDPCVRKQQYLEIKESVSVPDEILGEAPIVFVAMRQADAAVDELQLFCAKRLPPCRVPARLVVRPELPKLGAVGKIDRVSLRAAAITEHG